jgi:hypothetical protein
MSRILQISFIDLYAPKASGASVSVLRETAFLQKRHQVETIVVDWRDRLHKQEIEGVQTFARGTRLSFRAPFPCSSRVNAKTTAAVAKEILLSDYILVHGLQSYQLFIEGAKRAGGIGTRKAAIVFHDVESEYFDNAAGYASSIPAKLYYMTNSWQFKMMERRIVSEMRNLFFVTEEDMRFASSLVADNIARNMAVLKIPHGGFVWKAPDNAVTTIGYFGDCTLAVNRVPLEEELRQLAGLPIRVLIAGQGSEQIEGLPANTQALGYVDNLNEFLNCCDLLWFPIRHEGGVKVKMLDAIGSGAPIVATELALKGIPPQSSNHVVVYRDTSQLRQIMLDWKQSPSKLAPAQPLLGDAECLDPRNWL